MCYHAVTDDNELMYFNGIATVVVLCHNEDTDAFMILNEATVFDVKVSDGQITFIGDDEEAFDMDDLDYMNAMRNRSAIIEACRLFRSVVMN